MPTIAAVSVNICVTNLSYIRTYEADKALLPRIEMLYPSPNSDEPVVCVCDDNESEPRMTGEALPSAGWKIEPFTDPDSLEQYGTPSGDRLFRRLCAQRIGDRMTRARKMLSAKVLLNLLT